MFAAPISVSHRFSSMLLTDRLFEWSRYTFCSWTANRPSTAWPHEGQLSHRWQHIEHVRRWPQGRKRSRTDLELHARQMESLSCLPSAIYMNPLAINKQSVRSYRKAARNLILEITYILS